mmetsp:Transcript_24096/g.50843  ORF Transcript_24096/g.50843 Transcript_24096/m.50843 type:complete len:336 (+) Transcript_24096:146-1153(+)|eukprot:CAMPEP_0168164160 /NCGR_PEP_ID=MMETSP0139_2-20121125/781_1 /TAXON_ID=44445 /ORGANISM="Pseudo-nitzschia australis, Strain 10249 10 AB" /LENGTH=335 /DNA_ID=CAMNT_0008081143 /DNA_START=90 /DNA_END=1097 /DNA_ORIENTATION=+
MTVFEYISSSALSLTVSGNAGISPFLTLLLLGLVEMWKPNLLHMGETMERILASWWSILLLALLTAGEILAKCIPALDEIVDSVEVFVIPVLSILATLGTLGLLSSLPTGVEEDEDVSGRVATADDEDSDSGKIFGQGIITLTKVVLVIAGIVLSLLVHFFKMMVRVSSLVCSGGCCQPCITVLEVVMVVCGVSFAILSPIFAVIACIVLLVAAGYVIQKKCGDRKNGNQNNNDGEAPAGNGNDTGGDAKNNNNNNNNENYIAVDVENNPGAATAIATATKAAAAHGSSPALDGSSSVEPVAVAVAVEVEVEAVKPLPPPSSTPQAKLDLEATVY